MARKPNGRIRSVIHPSVKKPDPAGSCARVVRIARSKAPKFRISAIAWLALPVAPNDRQAREGKTHAAIEQRAVFVANILGQVFGDPRRRGVKEAAAIVAGQRAPPGETHRILVVGRQHRGIEIEAVAKGEQADWPAHRRANPGARRNIRCRPQPAPIDRAGPQRPEIGFRITRRRPSATGSRDYAAARSPAGRRSSGYWHRTSATPEQKKAARGNSVKAASA